MKLYLIFVCKILNGSISAFSLTKIFLKLMYNVYTLHIHSAKASYWDFYIYLLCCTVIINVNVMPYRRTMFDNFPHTLVSYHVASKGTKFKLKKNVQFVSLQISD